jgi:hypothetical protein
MFKVDGISDKAHILGSRILGAAEADLILRFNLFGPAATWIMVLVRFGGATNIFPAGTALFARSFR